MSAVLIGGTVLASFIVSLLPFASDLLNRALGRRRRNAIADYNWQQQMAAMQAWDQHWNQQAVINNQAFQRMLRTINLPDDG